MPIAFNGTWRYIKTMIITPEVLAALRAAAMHDRAAKGKSIDLLGKLWAYCMAPLAAVLWPLLTYHATADVGLLCLGGLLQTLGETTPGMRSLVDNSAAYVVNVGIIGTTIVLYYKTLVRRIYHAQFSHFRLGNAIISGGALVP